MRNENFDSGPTTVESRTRKVPSYIRLTRGDAVVISRMRYRRLREAYRKLRKINERVVKRGRRARSESAEKGKGTITEARNQSLRRHSAANRFSPSRFYILNGEGLVEVREARITRDDLLRA